MLYCESMMILRTELLEAQAIHNMESALENN